MPAGIPGGWRIPPSGAGEDAVFSGADTFFSVACTVCMLSTHPATRRQETIRRAMATRCADIMKRTIRMHRKKSILFRNVMIKGLP
jgi:hypothetical protein